MWDKLTKLATANIYRLDRRILKMGFTQYIKGIEYTGEGSMDVGYVGEDCIFYNNYKRAIIFQGIKYKVIISQYFDKKGRKMHMKLIVMNDGVESMYYVRNYTDLSTITTILKVLFE